MTHRKEVLDGDPVSFAESLDRSDDILHEIDLPEKQEQFRNVVWDHKEQIQGIVRLHRNVREPTTAAECMDVWTAQRLRSSHRTKGKTCKLHI